MKFRSDLTVGLGMRCEGWRRYGGALTFGPVKWAQCDNNAIVVLRVKQEKIEEFPACSECWQEALENKMEILEVKPIIPNAKLCDLRNRELNGVEDKIDRYLCKLPPHVAAREMAKLLGEACDEIKRLKEAELMPNAEYAP